MGKFREGSESGADWKVVGGRSVLLKGDLADIATYRGVWATS